MLEELYQELIISRAEDESHRGSLGEGALSQQLRNPLCGDEIRLWVRFDDAVAKECSFEGEGCLISRAAAAMLAEQIGGKTTAELNGLIADFESLIKGSAGDEVQERLGDLAALGGVSRFPARVRCALLACEALKRLLGTREAAESPTGA